MKKKVFSLMMTLLLGFFGLAQAVAQTTLTFGFEEGTLPSGWTVEGNGSWTVSSGDYSTSTGTHTGTYNAKCTHNSTGDVTYLVTDAMDFSGVTEGTINCWFINRSWAGDIDGFGVYYRVGNGAWNELYSTTAAHSSWSEMGEIALTGFAANYQIGFKMTDNYGYGVGLDDITITTVGGGGGSVISEIIDFEEGSLLDGWTVEGSGSWTVGVGDYTTSTGTHSGSYNAKCTHSSTGNMTYLVSPMFDFANAEEGTINCWFINRSWAGDIDYFGVYYRVNGGAWQELYYTTSAHSSWTEMGEIQLTGFASNYQFGFLMSDQYGYGVGLDDIEINVTLGEGPAYIPIDLVEINGFVAPVWGEPVTQEVTIPEDANYSLMAATWFTLPHGLLPGREMNPDPIYNLDERDYIWGFIMLPNEGYAFSPTVNATINGSSDLVLMTGVVTPEAHEEDPELPVGAAVVYTYAYYTYEEGLHTLSTYGVGDDEYESIDRLLIERPNGAWMEPYHFNLYNDGDRLPRQQWLLQHG